MKKIAIIFLLLLTIRIEAQKISLGCKVGLTSVNQWYPEKVPITINPRLSYEFGAVLNYKINRISTISIEPGFIEKGSIIYLIPISKDSEKYGYLTTSLLYKLSLYKGLYLEIGNEFGYLIYFKTRYIEPNSKPFTESMQNKKRFESAGLAGFSYSIFERLNLYLKLSFSYTVVEYTVWPWQSVEHPVQPLFNKYYSLGVRYFFIK